jgi:hypothetical protein
MNDCLPYTRKNEFIMVSFCCGVLFDVHLDLLFRDAESVYPDYHLILRRLSFKGGQPIRCI